MDTGYPMKTCRRGHVEIQIYADWPCPACARDARIAALEADKLRLERSLADLRDHVEISVERALRGEGE